MSEMFRRTTPTQQDVVEFIITNLNNIGQNKKFAILFSEAFLFPYYKS
jgi:hypothetical protein